MILLVKPLPWYPNRTESENNIAKRKAKMTQATLVRVVIFCAKKIVKLFQWVYFVSNILLPQ